MAHLYDYDAVMRSRLGRRYAVKFRGEWHYGLLFEGRRVRPSTMPKTLMAFGLRYNHKDDTKPSSVMIHALPLFEFFGTFVAERADIPEGREYPVEAWGEMDA